jgi:hypothetical protein
MFTMKSQPVLKVIRKSAARAWTVYAAFYLVTIAGGALVDAGVERKSGNLAPHIEAEQAAPCPAHDHQACQLCRTLLSLPIAPVGMVATPLHSAIVRRAAADGIVPMRPRRDPSQSPRAPPLL